MPFPFDLQGIIFGEPHLDHRKINYLNRDLAENEVMVRQVSRFLLGSPSPSDHGSSSG